MAFTGKSTYGAGADLPELAEDVSDIIGIVSPHETPLLDHLGDAKRPAMSTVHEWIEDALVSNTGVIDDSGVLGADTSFVVADGSPFRVGDLVRPGDSGEVMLVTGISADTLTVTRGYGGTTPMALANGLALTIIGNAALEGADAPTARFTSRVRRSNYTQIFTAGVDVSGSLQAARAYGVADEVDYQKQERMRELLRDLENTVINGVAPASDPQGSTTARRSMNGIRRSISTNVFAPGTIDTIVCGGAQKRRINAFASGTRAYLPEDTVYRDLVSVYESDFGVCRVLLSRWVPSDTVLLLDSSRISVMPLQGRSFHFKPLAATGDSVSGQVIGEYTLEFKNENAHGVIGGLGV